MKQCVYRGVHIIVFIDVNIAVLVTRYTKLPCDRTCVIQFD